MSECNCDNENHTPHWHDDDCPVYATRCDYCDGMGYTVVVLGCECCSDTETCEECHGSGAATEQH
jgi:hypothetical protein